MWYETGWGLQPRSLDTWHLSESPDVVVWMVPPGIVVCFHVSSSCFTSPARLTDSEYVDSIKHGGHLRQVLKPAMVLPVPVRSLASHLIPALHNLTEVLVSWKGTNEWISLV